MRMKMRTRTRTRATSLGRSIFEKRRHCIRVYLSVREAGESSLMLLLDRGSMVFMSI